MATKDKAVDTGERIKALFAQVEAGVKGVYESDNYRKYLSAMSKFHTYSFRNTLLILAQYPDATRVAGYNAWQNKFNRHVRKGEKGITILGYTPRTITTIQEKKDDSGKVMTGPDGKPATEKVERKVPAFTPVYVFDISQTEGDPLPQLVHNLEGEVDGFKKLMAALEHVSPFPIQFEEIKGGARGYCNPTAQRIAIRQGMSEAQTIKTAIHEITHAYLHGPGIDRDRHTEEVEAESVAFIVSDHYGIDTSDYSFPYLASWSSGRELAELTASLDTIQHKAFELIEGIDAQLREITKEQERTQERPAPSEQSPFELSGSQIQADKSTGVLSAVKRQMKDVSTWTDREIALFTVETDIKIYGEVKPETLSALRQQGFDYINGQLVEAHTTMAVELAVHKDTLCQSETPQPYKEHQGIDFKRSDKVPGLSFVEWVALQPGVDKSMLATSVDFVEAIGGALTEQTRAGKGKAKSHMKKVQYTQCLQEKYRGEVESGKVPMMIVQQPLNWAKEQDRAYVRMEIKRAQKAGALDKAAAWQEFYDCNFSSVKTPPIPTGIKAVIASAQARAEERAAARTEAKAQMLLSPDGRREM